jgi:hypothetical protein
MVTAKIYLLSDHAGLQVEGVLAYFMQLKHQKRIGDDVGDLKYFYKFFFFFGG